MAEQTTKINLINLLQAMTQIDLKDASVKTAYWISKNIRLLAPLGKEFNDLRETLTTTPIFKKYQEELKAAEESAKQSIIEKYKDVLADADAELKSFGDTLVDVPAWSKIAVTDIEGIAGNSIAFLFDMIKEEI